LLAELELRMVEARTMRNNARKKGPGRRPLSKNQKMVTIAARVPPADAAKLKRWADQKGVNRSKAIAEAIRRLVKA
jgi:hypothetical protein